MDQYKKITSLTHSEVIATVKLHMAKERRKKKMYIAEGLRTCFTILENGGVLHFLFVTQSMIAQVADVTAEKIIFVADNVMKKLSPSVTPSGILGVFHHPKQLPLTSIAKESGLILDGLQDPGNVGTLMRTSLALGKKTIVMINCVDPWNPKIVQASAGAIQQMHIIECSVDELLHHKGSNLLYALDPRGTQPIYAVDCAQGFLIIGSEAHGIQQSLLEKATHTVTIPMPGKTESLNAAIAGAIAMYSVWMLPKNIFIAKE